MRRTRRKTPRRGNARLGARCVHRLEKLHGQRYKGLHRLEGGGSVPEHVARVPDAPKAAENALGAKHMCKVYVCKTCVV